MELVAKLRHSRNYYQDLKNQLENSDFKSPIHIMSSKKLHYIIMVTTLMPPNVLFIKFLSKGVSIGQVGV